MAYPQRSNWGAFVNPQFNKLESQIQRETQALLRQRTLLGGNTYNNNYGNNQTYLKSVQSQKYIKLNSDRSNNTNLYGDTRNVLGDKVKQLIDLCKNENSSFGNQLIRVLNQQKNIYNDLVSSNKLSSQKTQYFGGTNPIIQAQKQSSVIQGSREQPLSGMSSGNQSPTKANNPPKSTIREAIQRNTKLQVGDDLLQMIEQIQRKALNQIEKLRQEKLDLMKQLKNQIQSNNQLQKQINFISQQLKSQKTINQVHQNNTPFKQYQQPSNLNTVQRNSLQQEILGQIKVEMDNLRKQNQNLRLNLSQKQPSQYLDSNSQILNLRNRNSLLENQLRNRDIMINQLTMEISRLNQIPGSSTGNMNARQLFEQGQIIRQNTLHLIKLKQGSRGNFTLHPGITNQNQRIRELQQLLERQQQQKQGFLNDLLAFKQKYQQLQQQNRNLKRQSSKIGSSDLTKLSPIIDKSGSGHNIAASLDDYQKLLYQMRGNRY